jgi:hypothetical protein
MKTFFYKRYNVNNPSLTTYEIATKMLGNFNSMPDNFRGDNVDSTPYANLGLAHFFLTVERNEERFILKQFFDHEHKEKMK